MGTKGAAGSLIIAGVSDEKPVLYKCTACGRTKSSRSAPRVAREHLVSGVSKFNGRLPSGVSILGLQAAQLQGLSHYCHRCFASLRTEEDRQAHDLKSCAYRWAPYLLHAPKRRPGPSWLRCKQCEASFGSYTELYLHQIQCGRSGQFPSLGPAAPAPVLNAAAGLRLHAQPEARLTANTVAYLPSLETRKPGRVRIEGRDGGRGRAPRGRSGGGILVPKPPPKSCVSSSQGPAHGVCQTK